jgi:hypothetical protein
LCFALRPKKLMLLDGDATNRAGILLGSQKPTARFRNHSQIDDGAVLWLKMQAFRINTCATGATSNRAWVAFGGRRAPKMAGEPPAGRNAPITVR